jgi:phage terminase large subunit-like protein
MNLTAAEVIKAQPDAIREAIRSLGQDELEAILHSWDFWARAEQKEPDNADWLTWLYMGGRGAGKTRSGAEWTKKMALEHPGCRIALVGPTSSDVRDVMIYGVSGLWSLHWDRADRPIHAVSKRVISWPNGSIAHTYSAEEPERLRGPQHHYAWCDEMAAWRYVEACWDMLSLGLRLEFPGAITPRCYISTTPRPISTLKEIVKEDTTVVTRGSTFSNRANLSAKFFRDVVNKYEGSTLGRQEIYGEFIEDIEGALWKRATIEQNKVPFAERPLFEKVVIAVDPASSDKASANECGIIACGRGRNALAYVIADYTTHGLNPANWGAKVVEAYKKMRAEYVVVEANLGGGLVETVLKQIDPLIPIRFVQARPGQSKYIRAEPVAMLYEQGRVKHLGNFAKLEDQMCQFTGNFQKENPGLSPDRVDALTWGITELMLDPSYDASLSWVG